MMDEQFKHELRVFMEIMNRQAPKTQATQVLILEILNLILEILKENTDILEINTATSDLGNSIQRSLALKPLEKSVEKSTEGRD